MELQQHFEQIRQLIKAGQARALQFAYSQQLTVYWQLGAYIHDRLESSEWGQKVVEELAVWLKESEPGLKGFDKRTLYRMKEFYLTWKDLDWKELMDKKQIVGSLNPQLKSADNQGNVIVGLINPQLQELPELPVLLSKLSWTHHVEILKRTASLEEGIFYLMLSVKERYTVAELVRQIKTSLFERQIMSSQKVAENSHPEAMMISKIFRDKYIFEFLDLPEFHSENDVQKGILFKLKQFILELGKDFIFMGEEFRIQVGMHDFFIDLLFFHRDLQCLVAFELKNNEFQPEYLGKLDFYLEALDKDVKKSHENPSIGVLLCKKQDKEVVEYALNRNLSPALVAAYETKMINKDLLQHMLNKWTDDVETE